MKKLSAFTFQLSVLSLMVLLATAVSAQPNSQQRGTRNQSQPAPGQASAPVQPIVLRGGKLLTITHGTINNGVVVMENGKISAVGVAASVRVPGNAQVIDVTGMTVYPASSMLSRTSD